MWGRCIIYIYIYIYIYIKFVKEEKRNCTVIAILQLTSLIQQMSNRATLLETLEEVGVFLNISIIILNLIITIFYSNT